MSRRRRDTASTPLITRLEALNEARQLGEGRVPEAAAADAYAVLERASKRRSLSAEHTVVGFFGATGSGKSSLFNAVAGQQLARAAATRPTTSAPLAAVWGEEGSGPLLDWLQVADRRALEDPLPAPKGNLFRKAPERGGLILLDLPDFDSTAAEHRETVRRLAGQVDVLVWVLDPQKYADAAVHHDFIRPMAGHGAITLVVLNQIDRLRPGQLDPVLVSLRGLLARDGLPGIDVLPVSAATGEGVGKLREAIGAVATERTAATERLLADVGAAADTLAGALAADAVPAATGPIAVLGAGWGEAGSDDAVPERGAPAPHQLELPGKDAARRLAEDLAQASGVGIVVRAVRDSYRKDAHARTGWPVVRWLGKLRPDPLRRLNLDSRDLESRGVNPALNRTALNPTALNQAGGVGAGAAQRAQADSAVRTFADAAAGGAPDVWRASIRRAARDAEDTLPDALDQAIAGTDIGAGRGSWWWPVVGIVQWIALAVALAGAAWLGGLAVMGFLQFQVPATPAVEGIPVPTLMLATGDPAGHRARTRLRVRCPRRRRRARPHRFAEAARRGRRGRQRADRGARGGRGQPVQPLRRGAGGGPWLKPVPRRPPRNRPPVPPLRAWARPACWPGSCRGWSGRRRCWARGDDAAVVAAPDGRFVVSMDTLVADQDFRLEWPNGYRTTGFDVGWKSAAQNLSDINAMGAVATALVISLTLPPDTPVAWVESLADGYSAAVRRLGAPLRGGRRRPRRRQRTGGHAWRSGSLEEGAPSCVPGPGRGTPWRSADVSARPRPGWRCSSPRSRTRSWGRPNAPWSRGRPARSRRWPRARRPPGPGPGRCWTSPTGWCATPAGWPRPAGPPSTWRPPRWRRTPRRWPPPEPPRGCRRCSGCSPGARTTGCSPPSRPASRCRRASGASAPWLKRPGWKRPGWMRGGRKQARRPRRCAWTGAPPRRPWPGCTDSGPGTTTSAGSRPIPWLAGLTPRSCAAPR